MANLLGRHYVGDLDKTLTSLRNDRLLPATFAHEINNLLFETKFLLTGNYNSVKIKTNLKEIEALAQRYEATDLTSDEAAKWTLFRTQLKGFLLTDEAISAGQVALRDKNFGELQHTLAQLVSIQVTESSHLMEAGKKAVSNNIMLSNLVAGLGLLFGLVTLVLLSVSRYAIHKPNQRHLLN